MNKKLLCVLLVAIGILSGLSAQNLMDNQHQKAGADFERQAAAAMDTGEYDKAAALSDQAAAEYRLSREYANNQILVYRAANAINLAKQGIANADRSAQATKYAAQITRAKVLLKEAEALYSASSWEASRAKAVESLDALKGIPLAVADTTITSTSGKTALPRWYIVGTWEKNRDCFWNIAKRPEVYGNPHLWQKLYEANKSRMKNPDNPNLIYPGMKMEIPSLKGEAREGTYNSGADYQTLPR